MKYTFFPSAFSDKIAYLNGFGNECERPLCQCVGRVLSELEESRTKNGGGEKTEENESTHHHIFHLSKKRGFQLKKHASTRFSYDQLRK